VARKNSIARFTDDELAVMLSETDWARVDSTSQADVERHADADSGPLPEGWADTVVLGAPEAKRDVHIRLDPAVVRWFKAAGPGYQTRINAVLRAFVDERTRARRGRT
jgi:uncharacterized protein (DUF4415 family)